MAPRIRPASPDDAALLLDLAGRVLDEEDPAPVHRAWTARLLAGEGPALAHGDVLIAEDGAEPVGMVWLLPQPLQVRGAQVPAGQVEQLAVVREHRGRGVARALVSALAARARERGFLLTFVRGETDLYARLGYPPLLPRGRPVLLPSGPPERPGALAVVPAGLGDARLLAAWDLAWPGATVRRLRDEAAWRTEVERDHGHPWRTGIWLAVDAGGTPRGSIGVLHVPGSPPVLHHLHVAPGSDAAAVGRAGLAVVHRCAGAGPAGLLLPPGHPVRVALQDLPEPVAASPWGVAVPDVVALFARVASGEVAGGGVAGGTVASDGVAGGGGAARTRPPPGVAIGLGGRTVRWDAGSAVVERPSSGGDPHLRITPAGLAALVLGVRSLQALVAGGAAAVADPRLAGVLAEALPPGPCDLWPLA